MSKNNRTVDRIQAVWNILGGEEGVDRLLCGAVKIAHTKVYKFLLPRNEIILPAIPDSCDSLGTSVGLYISDEFEYNFPPTIKEVGAPKTTIKSFDIVKEAMDAEIHSELPENYIFEDRISFRKYLTGMIKCQLKGKEGELLTNGNANIFYVRGVNSEVFAVGVYLYFAYGQGSVGACPLSGNRRGAGCRAFSRNH